jgi:poly(A) polymerase
VLEQAIDLEGPADGPPESVPGPDLVLRLAALLHDIGKPATRRFEPGGGVSFHHHEVVGAKLVAKRLRALRFDKETVKAVARLVELHLRFHGYGDGQWTDSAVRRYVTDAGPLLPRLHRLTRSDCTTRNVRKAPAWPPPTTTSSCASSGCWSTRSSAVRPELDGNEIAAVLGIPPGPGARAGLQVPALRAPRRGADRAGGRGERLRAWWAEQPEGLTRLLGP